MIKIEKTSIIGRFNLVDDSLPPRDDDHYIRQFSRQEINDMVHSGLDALQKGGEPNA